MFAEVRVPPVGVGASGAGAVGGELTGVVAVTLTAWSIDCFLVDCFRAVGFAARLSIASETPETQSRTPNKLRARIKPDLEDEFFFMVGLFFDLANKVK